MIGCVTGQACLGYTVLNTKPIILDTNMKQPHLSVTGSPTLGLSHPPQLSRGPRLTPYQSHECLRSRQNNLRGVSLAPGTWLWTVHVHTSARK